MVDEPEKLWMTAEEMGWPGSFRSFRMSDLEHPEEYPAYVRSDLYEQVKRERDEANADRDRWYVSSFEATKRAEAAERLAGARVAKADLAQRCGEILEWRRTGILREGSALSIMAESYAIHGEGAMRAAEDATYVEAISALADHPRDTNPVVSQKTANVRNKAGARVVVKPLRWGKYRNGDADAVTPFGEIYTAYASGHWRVTRNGKAGKFIQGGDNVEGAKAAAQADYERRILSALAEPAGEAEPVADEDEREDRIAALPYPDEAPASEVLSYVLLCARLWAPEARIIGNARAGDIVRALTTPPDASAIREALERGQAFANQVRAVTCHLNGQAYSSTVSALNYFDAALSRAALAGARP